tara:strand:- start:2501 stop:3823 length:1323 start_codon:yes stop_codon:yes gene_type:complete
MEQYELIITFTSLMLLFIVLLVIYLSNKQNNIINNLNKQNNKCFKVVEYYNKGELIKLCNKKTENCECFQHPCCVSNALEMIYDIQEIFEDLWLSGITLQSYIDSEGLNERDSHLTLTTSQHITDELIKKIEVNYIVEREENFLNLYYSDTNKLQMQIFYNTYKPELKNVIFYDTEISVPGKTKTLKNLNKAKALKLCSDFEPEDNDLNIHTCFIINQKGRNDRLQNSIRECDKYKLKCVQLEAIDGSDLNMENLLRDKILEKVSDFSITENTIACSMSHIKALKIISELETDKPCIIFEDDIKILDNFEETMTKLKKDIQKINWDILLLGCRLDNDNNQLINTEIPYIFKSGLVLGAYAYMVTPASSRKILKDIYPIKYPIDLTITIQEPNFITKRFHDKRFINKLKKYVIHTGNTFDDKRFGIVNELSTFIWRESTSS